jgi:hypothetical protein
MKHLLHAGAAGLLVAALSGCASVSRSGPAPLPVAAADRQLMDTASQIGDAQMRFADATDEAARRKIRDHFVFSRLALIDIGFIDYVRSMSGQRRHLDAATEATQMSLGVAATLTDSVQATSNLAAALALVTGLKSNVDKNYFDNQATDAILSTMAARRKEVLARILSSLSESTDGYTLLVAKMDTDAYYTAGTMEGAALVIQAEAAQRDIKADAEIRTQAVVRNIAANLTADRLATKTGLTRSLDPSLLSMAAATKALRDLGVGGADLPTTLDGAASMLQRIVRDTRDPEGIKHLKDVFDKAGIQPR